MGTDIDWMRDYVSDLANKPLGWLFIAGTFVHGWGNLALAAGLRGALRPGRLRTWAVLLFALAAVGILLASQFPIDPPDQITSTTGIAHRAFASATFSLELAAVFVFSAAFRHQRRWHRQQAVSLALSVSAAIVMTAFLGPGRTCSTGNFTGLGALGRLSTASEKIRTTVAARQPVRGHRPGHLRRVRNPHCPLVCAATKSRRRAQIHDAFRSASAGPALHR